MGATNEEKMDAPSIVIVCAYCGAEHSLDELWDIDEMKCRECKRGNMKPKSKFHLDGKFNAPRFVEWLFTHERFITVRDTQQMFYYEKESGTWQRDGETRLSSIMASVLKELYKKKDFAEALEYAKAETYANQDIFSPPSNLVNLANGVFDFSDYTFKEHSADYHFTYALNVAYDAKAEPRAILEFIEQITDGDNAKAITLLEGMAFTLMAGYPLQKALVLVGSGNNGKSTFLNVLRAFLGKENVKDLTLQQLTDRTFAPANLFGRLANISADLPNKPIADVGTFKALTGGDAITADRKHQGFLSFTNTAKLFFSANSIPKVYEDSDAYYRRFLIVEFTKAVENPDPTLLERLTAPSELSGLFNVLIKVFLPVLWRNRRFTMDRPTEEIRRQYMLNSDSALAFITMATEADPDAQVLKSEFYAKYQEFCRLNKLMELPEVWTFRNIRMFLQSSYSERQIQENGTRQRYILGLRMADPIPNTCAVDGQNSLKIQDYLRNNGFPEPFCLKCTGISSIFLSVALELNIEKIYKSNKMPVLVVHSSDLLTTNNCTTKNQMPVQSTSEKMESHASTPDELRPPELEEGEGKSLPDASIEPSILPIPNPAPLIENAVERKQTQTKGIPAQPEQPTPAQVHAKIVAFWHSQPKKTCDYAAYLSTIPEQDQASAIQVLNTMWTSGELVEVKPNTFRLASDGYETPNEMTE